MKTAVVVMIAATCCMCVAHADKANIERLVPGSEREKRQVDEWPISFKQEKALLFLEEKRRNASEGEAFSLMARADEKCDKDCIDGTYLEGSCSMDCRQYYYASRVKKLEDRTTILIMVIIILSLLVLIAFLGTYFIFSKRILKLENDLGEKIKQQKLQGHPTCTPHQPAEEAGENDAFVEIEEGD